MFVSELKLYELLQAKIGKKEAEAFVEILEKNVEYMFELKKNELATKQDLFDLRAELLRTIYLTSVSQFIAIVAAVVSLILVLKK